MRLALLYPAPAPFFRQLERDLTIKGFPAADIPRILGAVKDKLRYEGSTTPQRRTPLSATLLDNAPSQLSCSPPACSFPHPDPLCFFSPLNHHTCATTRHTTPHHRGSPVKRDMGYGDAPRPDATVTAFALPGMGGARSDQFLSKLQPATATREFVCLVRARA